MFIPPPKKKTVSSLVDNLFLFDHVNEIKGGGQPLFVNWHLVLIDVDTVYYILMKSKVCGIIV